LEITMITRRIVISACALSLAVPAVAGARPATDPPRAKGPYGITSAAYPKLVKAKGPYGMTAATYPRLVEAQGPYGTTAATYPKLVKAQGPYGTTAATYPNLVEAKGPYGTTVAASAQHTTAATATAHPAGVSGRDPANRWRIAAVSEAALLAALAFGSALLLVARRHPPRLGV
jgi:hypothetical protein